MKNELLLGNLICTAYYYGVSDPRTTTLKQRVLEKMAPEIEIVPRVEGETVTPKPPPLNPEELPGGLITSPQTLQISETLHPDGGGTPQHGKWIPMDGGGLTFEENQTPDEDDGL